MLIKDGPFFDQLVRTGKKMLVIKKLTRYTCRLSNLCASRKINAVLKVRLAVGPPSADADC